MEGGACLAMPTTEARNMIKMRGELGVWSDQMDRLATGAMTVRRADLTQSSFLSLL